RRLDALRGTRDVGDLTGNGHPRPARERHDRPRHLLAGHGTRLAPAATRSMSRGLAETVALSRAVGGEVRRLRPTRRRSYSAPRRSMICSITRSKAPGPTEIEPWYGWSMSAVTNITRPMN